MIEQEWQKNKMCHWQLPCLGLVSTPSCQEPWNLLGAGWAGLCWIWKAASYGILHQRWVTPGWQLRWISQGAGMGETDRCICALRTPKFGRCSKVSTSLSHITTLLSLKVALAWNNFSYIFFSCLRSFSMCLHLCNRSCFQPCADVLGSAKQQFYTQGTKFANYFQPCKRLAGQKQKTDFAHVLKAAFEKMITCTNKLEEI